MSGAIGQITSPSWVAAWDPYTTCGEVKSAAQEATGFSREYFDSGSELGERGFYYGGPPHYIGVNFALADAERRPKTFIHESAHHAGIDDPDAESAMEICMFGEEE
jgi:hypothetical protein